MSQAYIMEYYKVNKAQLDLIDDLCLLKDSRTFLCHTLVSNLIKWGEAAPISYELIKTNIPEAQWKSLADRGLIEASGYSYTEHKSREFTVNSQLIDLFLEAGRVPLEEAIKQPKYNLFTGRLCNAANKNDNKLSCGHPIPALVRDSIASINYCIGRLESLEAYVINLEKQYAEAKEEYFNNKTITKKEFDKIAGIYYNSANCFLTIINQNPIKVDTDLYSFAPAYKTQMSGRITFIGGGIQNMSREMQDIFYKDIKDLHNYDLQASQVNGLIQQFEMAKLVGVDVDTEWLVNYKNNSNSKYEYAALIGVSVDCWKDMLCSTIMGSSLPDNIKKAQTKLEKEESSAAILNSLSIEFSGDIYKILDALAKYVEVVEPLKKSLDNWHNYLINEYITLNGYKTGNKCIYISNPTGMKINITKLFENPKYTGKRNVWRAKALIAHFVLAGQEAAFIHQLTVLGKLRNEHITVSNAHDGIVTLGEVMPKTVSDAANLSGLKSAILVEKPFN